MGRGSEESYDGAVMLASWETGSREETSTQVSGQSRYIFT